jgi:hypothetical protein
VGPLSRLGTVLLPLAIVSCAAVESRGSLEGLRDFVRNERFLPPKDSLYPEPLALEPGLEAFVQASYQTDPLVRLESARCFLMYESVLLKKNLFSVAGERGTLVSILWDKESRRGYPGESPGIKKMHDYILMNTEWFALDREARSLLEVNDAEFREAVARFAK